MKEKAIAAFAAVMACTAPAVAQAAQPGSYGGKLYGINDTGLRHPIRGTDVTFQVKNGSIRSFKAKGGVSSCMIVDLFPPFIPHVNIYPLTFTFPAAPVRNNTVEARYRVKSVGVTNTLKGTFKGRAADGRIDQTGPRTCFARYHWKAKLR